MKVLPLVFNNGAHPFFALRAPPVASRAVVGVLAVSAMVAATLLSTGRSAYPDLHNILDTGACLLSGVLALLLWDISARKLRQTLTAPDEPHGPLYGWQNYDKVGLNGAPLELNDEGDPYT